MCYVKIDWYFVIKLEFNICFVVNKPPSKSVSQLTFPVSRLWKNL